MSPRADLIERCSRLKDQLSLDSSSALGWIPLSSSDIQKLGLLVGAIYFFWRLYVESQRAKAARIRTQIELLLSYINEYDKVISPYIHAKTLRALKKEVRAELVRIFALIQNFLEISRHLKFSEGDLQKIQDIHSVIDQSSLMRGNLSDVPNMSVRTDYLAALKNARLICFEKLC